jgi:hypothetical protein
MFRSLVEIVFERANLLRYRAMRDAQFFGGFGEAAEAPGGLETAQRVQWG